MAGPKGKVPRTSRGLVAGPTGRGRYDRTASASERARHQRAELLRAVRAVCARGEDVTVARLLEEVGCGRNTFYEHFDDATKAVDAACEDSAKAFAWELEEVLTAATPRTPGDAMHVVVAAWAAWLSVDEGRDWALLERMNASRMDEVLLSAVLALRHYLVSVGYVGDNVEIMRAHAIVGALRAIARGVKAQRLSQPEAEALTISTGYDVLTRLLR